MAVDRHERGTWSWKVEVCCGMENKVERLAEEGTIEVKSESNESVQET